MNPFLIVGLPRSRTAWLSVLCSSLPGVICYHEPIIKHADWGPVYRLWAGDDYDHVGIADPHMGFKLDHLLKTFAPRTLIVRRPIEEVEASLHELEDRPSNDYCAKLSAHLDAAKGHALVKVVPFADLHSPDVVEACLAHLLPGVIIDSAKLEELLHMNIQTDMTRVWDAAKRLNPDLFRVAEVASCR